MMEKGVFVKWMERLFGASWKTSLYGVLVFLSGASALIQQYLVDMKVPQWVLITAFLLFGLLRSLNTKDSQVTGGSITQSSLVKPPPGPVTVPTPIKPECSVVDIAGPKQSPPPAGVGPKPSGSGPAFFG